MSFELYTPVLRASSLKPGECSLNRMRRLTIHGSDLRRHKISSHAAILLDRQTGRIALRPPRDGEPAAIVMWNKSKTCAAVNAGSALESIGLEVEKLLGRHKIEDKDDLLVVQFHPKKK